LIFHDSVRDQDQDQDQDGDEDEESNLFFETGERTESFLEGFVLLTLRFGGAPLFPHLLFGPEINKTSA